MRIALKYETQNLLLVLVTYLTPMLLLDIMIVEFLIHEQGSGIT